MIGVVSAVWLLSLAALFVLWLRRPHSVIDVWLMVVLCAWLFDIALSAIVNVARFDLGFYVGRIYGLCAASFVLAVLLFDNVALQAQLSRLLRTLRRQAARKGSPHRTRAAVQRGGGILQRRHHHAGRSTAPSPPGTGPPSACLDLRAAEAVGQRIDIIVPPDRRAEARDPRPHWRGEHVSTKQCGGARTAATWTYRWASLRSDPAGEIIGASKTARDIGERKRTQAALDQEIEERRRIFETSQDLILVTDTTGNFVQVSPS